LSKLEQRTCLTRVSRIGDTVRDSLVHVAVKTSTVQYIIYHIKRTVLRLVSSCENDSAVRTLEFLFPSPVAPRKKSTTYPKTSPHEISHHQCTYPLIDPIGKLPSINPVHRTTAKDSYPEPASDHALTSSRTRISSPLVITREQRRTRSIQSDQPPQKERNRDVCPSNGPGLSVHWPQSGD